MIMLAAEIHVEINARHEPGRNGAAKIKPMMVAR
jgi:hypothetical protein